MAGEVVQENFTVEFNEEKSIVEIRYEGLSTTRLNALSARVSVLESTIDAALDGTAGSIGTITTTLDALETLIDALTVDLGQEESARIAADAQIVSDRLTGDNAVAATVTAETNARIAADAAEVTARNAAITAATGPIITTANALQATVTGQGNTLSALSATVVGLDTAVDTLTGEVDLLDTAVDSLNADLVSTDAAIIAETAARIAADAAVEALIPTTPEIQDIVNAMSVVKSVNVPASATATGTAGTVAYDANYLYICTATDTWKRVAIATW